MDGSSSHVADRLPFDPDFNDCAWTDEWTRIPVMQVLPGRYESFSVRSWQLTEAEVCGRHLTLDPPLAVRGLVTDDGVLWMSDVPQERLMMFNNARRSRGHILIGGLGLGLYLQYALPHADRMTVIEASPAVAALVQPVIEVAAQSSGIPIEVQIARIEDVLAAPPVASYDTIFLDTWDTLDAVQLPDINHLRDLAVCHLAPGGRVLLWGYQWMVRLFEEACVRLLTPAPGERQRWLEAAAGQHSNTWRLLLPVLSHFRGKNVTQMDAALDWCRQYITQVTLGDLAGG